MSPVSCGVYLLSLLLFLSSPGCLAQWRQIYIDPINGSNTTDCLVSNSPHQPCRNLSYAIEHNHTTNWIEYVLSPGRHYFGINITFRGLQGVAITGSENASTNTTIECSAENAGFAFIRVSGIFLKRITFHQCASLQDTASQNFTASASGNFTLYKVRVALYFYLCQNVSMSFVTVAESPNATGVIIYDTTGTNTIENSDFVDNRVKAGLPFPGGGGIYIEFTYCIPGDNSCKKGKITYISKEFNSNSSYTFSGCRFRSNGASNGNRNESIAFSIPYHTNHEAFGRGGGLSLFIKGNASNNTFIFSDCEFANNTAPWGAGLFAEFQDNAVGNQVIVTDTWFLNNYCFHNDPRGTDGGGLKIAQYVFEPEGVQGFFANNITVRNCKFRGNYALDGGGLSVSPMLQNDSDSYSSTRALFVIQNCSFEKNTARLGAAVYINQYSFLYEGQLPNIQFIDCNFTNNSVVNANSSLYQTGVGAVYVNAVPVQFCGHNNFVLNNGTALAVFATHLDFSNSQCFFVANSGHKGGAIALLGAAWLLINDNTTMLFGNNSAKIHGGAIYNRYIDQQNLQRYFNCFIRHKNPFLIPEQWNAYFTFDSNTDGVRGSNSIHSTSILPCAWAARSHFINTSQIFCWTKWTYIDHPHDCSKEISSDVGDITFSGTASVQVIPGKLFRVPLEVQDDSGHVIGEETVFSASSDNLDVAIVDPHFSYLTDEILSVMGIQNRSFSLILDTVGDRVWHVEVQVELQMCPPGFVPSNTMANSTCVCTTNNYDGVVMCDQTFFNASLVNGYWMGVCPDHNYTLVVALSPPGFCYTDPNSAFLSLPNSTDDLDAQICGRVHRTGIMCGECENGYGPAINLKTFDCVLCNNTSIAANTAYYLLSVYLPLLVLFIVIIIFNIRLTTGPANSFILYSQLISSTFDLSADGRIPINLITPHYDRLLKAYRLPYGIFNLNFFEQFVKPLCLGTQLNALDVLELQYGVAVFPLLMIVIVVLFIKLKEFVSAKCFQRSRARTRTKSQLSMRRWRIGSSLVHAFAAFVLLSYTKFSLTSSYLVAFQPVLDEGGHRIGPLRVYYGGQYAWNTPEFVFRYLLPAIIIFVVFVIIPPLFLFSYPVIYLEKGISKVKWLRKFYPADKIQILLDTFQGCYEDNMRFFAGFYVFVRLAINFVYAFTNNWLQRLISQQIICVIIIVVIALCKPYRKEKKLFNYVDILMFANLALLNALSLYLYEYSLNNPGQGLPLSAFVVQYILVFLPLIYMLTYIIWYLTTPYHQQVRQWLKPFWARRRSYQPLDNVARVTTSSTDVDLSSEEEGEIEAMLERAQLENTYKPRELIDTSVEVGHRQREPENFQPHVQRQPHVASPYGSVGHTIVTAPK